MEAITTSTGISMDIDTNRIHHHHYEEQPHAATTNAAMVMTNDDTDTSTTNTTNNNNNNNSNNWESNCQRLVVLMNTSTVVQQQQLVEIFELVRDIRHVYDTTISHWNNINIHNKSKCHPTKSTTHTGTHTDTGSGYTTGRYHQYMTTVIPILLQLLQPSNSNNHMLSPSDDVTSWNHQIRHLILEFITTIVQTHTTTSVSSSSSSSSNTNTNSNTNNSPSGSNSTTGTTITATVTGNTSGSSHRHGSSSNVTMTTTMTGSGSGIFTLRQHATSIIDSMMIVLQTDYELLSVVAIRIVFDLYKHYRTTISSTPIQSFLNFVIALYQHLPQSVQSNFQPDQLLRIDNNNTNATPVVTSTTTAAMDVEAPPVVAAVTAIMAGAEPDVMEIDHNNYTVASVVESSPPVGRSTTEPSAPPNVVVVVGTTTTVVDDAQKVMDIIDHSFDDHMVTTTTTTIVPTTTTQEKDGTTTTTTTGVTQNEQQQQQRLLLPMDTTTTTTTTTTDDILKPPLADKSYNITIPTSSLSPSALSTMEPNRSSGSALSTTTQQQQQQQPHQSTMTMTTVLYKSNVSFQVLTECPLIVMLLMFQLHPQQFIKPNVLTFIQLMMDALSLRPPPLPPKTNSGTTSSSSIAATTTTKTTGGHIATSMATTTTISTGTTNSITSSNHPATTTTQQYEQMHMIRARELIAAQAKTLSFLTYLLRSFVTELKPYQDKLAVNVIALMSICPRDAISTRKELLVATRHILNSEFRTGFFKHIDSMIDERILMGGTTSITSNHRPDPTIIRPLAYTTLADFVQHTRHLLSMTQMNKVVCLFSRIIHDTSIKMPLTTQFTAVRTLISVIDIVYNNKDPDPQIGRDILVRLLNTMVDKLHALNDYYPDVVKAEYQRNRDETATLEQCTDETVRTKWLFDTTIYHPTTDTVREVQSLIRTIFVSQKNMIYYLCNYRNQRLEHAAAAAAAAANITRENIANDANSTTIGTIPNNNNRGAAMVVDASASLMPPVGSNEEVSSALLKLTYTEIAIIDRYIKVALTSMKLLSEADKTGTNTDGSGTKPIPTTGNTDSGEKTISELHRDSLTYFAATFTAMDGYNLRRSLGRRMDLLVDAIVDEPLTMIIPRHLLSSNGSTSYEFCSLLLDYLVDRMDLLGNPNRTDIIFVDEQPTGNDVSEEKYLKATIHSVTQRPEDSNKRHRQRTATLVQLFERVLKSLSVFPDNEVIVRKHLRHIVATCLRSSFENTTEWPESYAMLLRFVFRSISAGKFEDSYRELLSLIPTVLNGLCRIVVSADDSVLRSTAIELCLTIPARLSSLLPHMNLLLRIIIPALDSNSNELVNLGLRTLEFWVDNLNHLFLYPEMSKCTALFTSLMQSLSRHLRPAPYPYGLLTLRLLGKLGGKNRQFLRDPMQQQLVSNCETKLYISAQYKGMQNNDAMIESDGLPGINLPLPLQSCVDMLREIAVGGTSFDLSASDNDKENNCVESPIDPSSLWDSKIEDLDVQSYSRYVINSTRHDQAEASMSILQIALAEVHFSNSMDIDTTRDDFCCKKMVYTGLLFACMVDATEAEASAIIREKLLSFDRVVFSDCFASFMSEPSIHATKVGLGILDFVLHTSTEKDSSEALLLLDAFIYSLCATTCNCSWGRHYGLLQAINKMIVTLGAEWSRKYEVNLINATLLALKTQPRELSEAAVRALSGFIRVCHLLYGEHCQRSNDDDNYVWDALSVEGIVSTGEAVDKPAICKLRPSEDVFKIIVYEMTSPQQLVRFASRFLLKYFVVLTSETDDKPDFVRGRIDLIRRVLFSRTLRLLPLPHQVGAVEGLATIVNFFPSLFPLTDQHVLTFLSELLKMASVADGEMTDTKLNDIVVDKDGFVPSETASDRSRQSGQSTSLFYRRECVVEFDTLNIVIPCELSYGVQFRVSSIILLHSIIKHFSDDFFDADPSTPIGNIRPHVISLLFRSLVSHPLRAVNSAHYALSNVLALSSVKPIGGDEIDFSNLRIPKDLLQTCIRPVLLQLREYKRLSVPLLRGLARLLLILGSWFNKTLGEKLLDHLRKWTDPSVIIAHKIWMDGEEPLVAAAIIDIFSLLPYATQFVEHLVKTCIKLESTLHLFKSRLVEAPYRRPLARYLNKHSQFAVGFFFPRFKTPMYSELFQYIVELDESTALREYLSTKQCSDLLLHVSFERPLAIIRSEKTSSGDSKNSLSIHGIGKQSTIGSDLGNGSLKPMNTEALEMQHQGLRIVNTLMMYDPMFFKEHSDIVRASRWLWRSRGRLLRQQYEEVVSPRFQDESKLLATFRMNYAKSFPNEAIDIIFELFRVFLQPSTIDFGFVSRFLVRMVTEVLTVSHKKKVLSRFFASITGDTNEEIKVLGIQFLVIPMLSSEDQRPFEFPSHNIDKMQVTKSKVIERLIDKEVLHKFIVEVLFQHGKPISCGSRLSVELLRLLNHFVSNNTAEIEPFQNDVVQYCWTILKSENMTCRCWAYVVLCRIMSLFDAPSKLVRRVYFSLLKMAEERKLVRAALDLLVPAFYKRLDNAIFTQTVNETIDLMADEGIAIVELAQIVQTIIRNPNIFESQCSRFVTHMIAGLHRLGLQSTGNIENRFLAVNAIELSLAWAQKREKEIGNQIYDNADTLCNFLIRLKMQLSESQPDARNILPFKTSTYILDLKVLSLLGAVMSKYNVKIRVSPFEKVLGRERKLSGPLVACLEIVSTAVKFRYVAFLNQHAALFRDIIDTAVVHSHQDITLQSALRNFVSNARESNLIISFVLVAFDKAMVDALFDQTRLGSSDRSSDRSRTKDRPHVGNDTTDSSAFILYAIEIIADFCKNNCSLANMVGTTLLTLAKSMSKQHLSDTAAKLRQSASTTSRAPSSGIKYPTPTIGILEEAVIRDRTVSARLTKARQGKEVTQSDVPIRSLIIVLSIFETSGFLYIFTEIRKTILQIISNILDSSDNVQLIMIAVRCVGKSLLSNSPGSPLTDRERISLLERICAFDYSNLADDVISQPLSDLISNFALRFAAHPSIINRSEGNRLLAACTLSASQLNRSNILQELVSRTEIDIADTSISQILWVPIHLDFEGIGSRFWIAVFVDVLLQSFTDSTKKSFPVESLSTISHGNTDVSLGLLQALLSWTWSQIPNDALRIRFISFFERLLSQPYHAQFLRSRSDEVESRSLNCVKSFLNITTRLNPVPVLDTNLLLYVAENYNCWYEVVALLEKQYLAFKEGERGEVIASAMRHCYKQLGDEDVWRSLAKESCMIPGTKRALSLDTYDIINDAVKHYSDLMKDVESDLDPSDFEMDLWEERWIVLEKELCQFQVVAEFANASDSPMLKMECAWKAQDWAKVRSLCTSPKLLPLVESGDQVVKLSETLVAVADGKLSEVENLHAQTAQLCLYKWQLLPQLSSGSFSHSSLLHFFHRLVEIRESGQIMVETNNHSIGKTLPDLKNLLSAWRHRLPNEWDKLSKWDDVFVWRAHMFSAISSNLSWCDTETLAAQHDQPWTALRMAKTARKQGLRDVTLLLLSRVTDDQAMNVTDAYAKLRERILALYNLETDEQAKLERQSGLSLINATNLSFFDASQNSELFRLRALFLQSLQGRSKANQAFCHSVQICPTHARAWDSWGELCASLGTSTEKQIEQGGGYGENNEANKDAAVKKVRQYLAQAMGCYLEGIQIDGHEWARLRIPKCLWMLTKDGSTPGVLCHTLESRGVNLPPWVWLPWIPQLLTCLYRKEGRTAKAIFARLVKSYPQAVYYPLRTFYLERRDVDRGKSSSSTAAPSEQLTSVSHAEELMSLLRRSHASLWSALEPCLEELIVKFRHSYEEELLATIVVLLERTETQFGNFGRKDDDKAVATSVWKTLGKIAVKFFRQHERDSTSRDTRAEKTARFKEAYKGIFESDFQVSSSESSTPIIPDAACPIGLDEIVDKLRNWKRRLEDHVVASPESVSLVESSHSLAMFGVGDVPDLWPGSCDPLALRLYSNDRDTFFDNETTTTPSTTSSSAAAARKAARTAGDAASESARREGVGGDYGGGSSCIEIPGQYVPNTCSWRDTRPCPELHVKLLKFEPTVVIIRRNDTLVRKVGMVGSDGKTYYFLLQIGVSYLARTDERSSQTLYVLDKVLRKDMKSSRALLSVQSHPSIPVAQRLRLIYEPEGRTSLEDVYREFCHKSGVHHSELTSNFCDDVKKRLTKKLSIETIEEKNFVDLEKSTRLDVYNRIRSSNQCNEMILSNHAMSMLGGAESFYQFRRMFAQQWSANSLLQYTFSAMDRTPSKVIFDYSSGRVHATEFRLAYTNQGILENQHVPFRLTPNLETLIGFPMLDARYTTSMALIAGAVQQNQQDLDPIFRLLMRDDLIAYFTKSLAKSDATSVEMEKQLAGSVARNVALLHTRFAECAPSTKMVITKQQIYVDQRVRDLIDSARNPEHLCLMPGSFQGWL